MYSEARLQFILVIKDSYDKGMQSYVECARNTTFSLEQAMSQRCEKMKKKKQRSMNFNAIPKKKSKNGMKTLIVVDISSLVASLLL